MSDKERNAVENVVRGRQPVLVALPVKHTSRHTHTHTPLTHTHTRTQKHICNTQLAQVELSEDEVDEPAEVEEEEEEEEGRNILEPQVIVAHARGRKSAARKIHGQK